MSVMYATANGVLLDESRNGTVTTYVADTLGSVIKTVDGFGAVMSETMYWPCGEVKSTSAINSDPLDFVGTLA